MDAAYRFSAFAARTTFKQLPKEIVGIVKLDIMDTLGCWLGGGDSGVVTALLGLMTEMGGRPEATVLGHDIRLPASRAGLINATRVVAVDYDDHHDPAHCHIGATSLPTALAVAEKLGGVSGKDFITAIAVGSEIACRLGKYTVRRHLNHVMGGWDYTFTLGIFSAAAIAAKLLGLDADGIHNALGLAYHQASGTSLSAMDKADTKDLGSGFACAAGIESAFLAQRGVTGAKNIFDEYDGSFARQYNAGADREALVAGLGSEYELKYLGFKEYPCCTNTHRYIDAVRDIMRENHIAPGEVEQIVLKLSPMLYPMCVPEAVTKTPPDAISGKFSIPWTVACMAAKGRVGIGEFYDAALRDPDILDMARRIVSIEDAAIADYETPADVTIVTLRGGFTKKTSRELYGHWRNPMTGEALKDKFRACAATADKPLPRAAVEKLVDTIMDLENIPDATALLALASGR